MQGKRNIWILNHYAIKPTEGGITRHYDFAEELVKRGHKVKIFASSFEHRLRVERLQPEEKIRKENVNGVEFIWLKTFPYQKNDIRRIINMITFAIALFFAGIRTEKPDVIIASSFHPFTCIAGLFLAKLKKARYIAEIRDLWPQTAVDMGAIKEGQLVTRVLRRLEKFIYRQAEEIIVLLPGAVEYIKSVGISPEKVTYIPNGVNIDRYNESLQAMEQKQVENIVQRHQGKFKAIYLGGFGEANALEVIIDAAKIVQEKGYIDIHFLLVGDGPEREKLIQRVRNYKLENVFFYEPIKKTNVPQLLKNVELCLFNLGATDVFKYGISPNKLFDYLCSAKPIVFACKTSNDIVSASHSGISVSPENPQAFAEAVIDIYNLLDHDRKLLGENGKRYLERFHDIPLLVDTLESIV